jgi:hypothetical protein
MKSRKIRWERPLFLYTSVLQPRAWWARAHPCSDFLYSLFRTDAWAHLFLFCSFILSSSGTALWALIFLLCSVLSLHHVSVSSGGPFLLPHCSLTSRIPSLPSSLSSSRTAFFTYSFAALFICQPPLLLCELTCFFSAPFSCHPTLLYELRVHFLLRYSLIVPRCCVSSRVPFLYHHSFPHCSVSPHVPYLLRYSLIFPHCSVSSHVPYLLHYSLVFPHCSVSPHVPYLLHYSPMFPSLLCYLAFSIRAPVSFSTAPGAHLLVACPVFHSSSRSALWAHVSLLRYALIFQYRCVLCCFVIPALLYELTYPPPFFSQLPALLFELTCAPFLLRFFPIFSSC